MAQSLEESLQPQTPFKHFCLVMGIPYLCELEVRIQ